MKFKKIFIVGIFLIFILSLSVVNATEYNSTDFNIKLTNEDANNIVDSSNNMNLENDLNQDNYKLKSSIKNRDKKLKKVNSNENNVKSISSESVNIEVPKKVEFYGYGYYEFINMNISLPKNSKGKLSIYKDNNHIKTFDLSDEEPKSTFYDICRIYQEDNNNKDIYHIAYRLTNIEIGIRNFTFKYEEDDDFIEKSSVVNITYILKPSTNKLIYSDNSLLIDTPPNLKGKISVEIDGRKYKTYTKTYKNRLFPNYKNNCVSKCILRPNGKVQYVKISPKLSPGKHKIKITYSGDKIYPSRTVEYILIVSAKIKAESFYSGENRKVSLELPKKAKGKLVLKFYDSKKKLVKTFTKKLKKGKAVIIIPKKFYGKFSKAVAKYTGSDYKVKQEVMKNLVIEPPVSAPKTMLQGEKKFVSINLPGKKGVLKLYMYNYDNEDETKETIYSKKLVKGKAKISLSRFTDNDDINYVEFIETLKNGKKVKYTIYKYCSIFKPLSITHDKLYYGDAEIRIQAYKKGGKILKNKGITVKINGKFVKKVKTNKYGIANFKIPKKYKPKKYKLTVKYKKNILSEKIKIYKANKKSKKKPKLTVVYRAC